MRKTALILLLIVTTVILTANLNYKLAIHASCDTNGSDIEIENKMFEYGYNIDAYSCEETTQADRLSALFTLATNQY